MLRVGITRARSDTLFLNPVWLPARLKRPQTVKLQHATPVIRLDILREPSPVFYRLHLIWY
jgi:hypothetical protein